MARWPLVTEKQLKIAVIVVALVGLPTYWLWPVADDPDAMRDSVKRNLQQLPVAKPAQPAATVAPQLVPDAAPLALPGQLPPIDRPIAPPLQPDEPPPFLVARRGQVSESDGNLAARAAWPALLACGLARTTQVQVKFALSGGLQVGSSAVYGPDVTGAVTPEQRACVVSKLAETRAPVATDCQGDVAVSFNP